MEICVLACLLIHRRLDQRTMTGFLQVKNIIDMFSPIWTTSWCPAAEQNRLCIPLAINIGWIKIMKWSFHVIYWTYALERRSVGINTHRMIPTLYAVLFLVIIIWIKLSLMSRRGWCNMGSNWILNNSCHSSLDTAPRLTHRMILFCITRATFRNWLGS